MRMITPYFTANRTLGSDIFDEMDRFMSDWSLTPTRSYQERQFDPSCDIAESEDHFLLSVDLPGMKKEDIKIELNENVLTVSGERKREHSDTHGKYQRFEKTYGSFQRRFSLPSTVESGKVEARYEDGVLELCLPKAQAAKPRQIEIQSGQGGLFSKFLGSKKTAADLKDVSKAQLS